MASPAVAFVPLEVRRPTAASRVKRHLHFSPAWVFPGVLVVLTIIAIVTYVLMAYLLLLIAAIVANAIMGGVYLDVKRTGDYWYVPFSSHPEHRKRR
jgi:hypothetical protein